MSQAGYSDSRLRQDKTLSKISLYHQGRRTWNPSIEGNGTLVVNTVVTAHADYQMLSTDLIWCSIDVSFKTPSGTSDGVIVFLPFVVSSESSQLAIVECSDDSSDDSSYEPCSINFISGTTEALVLKANGQSVFTQDSATKRILGNFTYLTNKI